MTSRKYTLKPEANLRGANLRGATLCDADLESALITFRGNHVRIRFEAVSEADA